MTDTLLPKNLIHTTRILKLIANPFRIRIMFALLHHQHDLAELAKLLELSPAVVASHLDKLRNAKLIEYTRFHRVVQYQIATAEVYELLNAIYPLCFPHGHAPSTVIQDHSVARQAA